MNYGNIICGNKERRGLPIMRKGRCLQCWLRTERACAAIQSLIALYSSTYHFRVGYVCHHKPSLLHLWCPASAYGIGT